VQFSRWGIETGKKKKKKKKNPPLHTNDMLFFVLHIKYSPCKKKNALSEFKWLQAM